MPGILPIRLQDELHGRQSDLREIRTEKAAFQRTGGRFLLCISMLERLRDNFRFAIIIKL